MSRMVGGVVLQPPWPSEGQPAGRTYLAEQQIRRGPATLVTRVPHLKHCLNFVEPRNCHWLAYVHHHNGIGVDVGNAFDKLCLVARQTEVRRPRPHTNTMAVLDFFAAATAAA